MVENYCFREYLINSENGFSMSTTMKLLRIKWLLALLLTTVVALEFSTGPDSQTASGFLSPVGAVGQTQKIPMTDEELIVIN